MPAARRESTLVRLAKMIGLALLAGLLVASQSSAQQTGALQGEPAQVGIVAGVVRSASSKQPLADVPVRVAGTRLGAMTDAEGRFRIANVPAGETHVVAQRVGLGGDTLSANVAANAETDLRFELEDVAAVIAPTVVSATRERQRREEASATIDVLDGAEVRRTRASHPSMLMNRLPGVHVSDLSGEGHSMSMRQPITTKPMYLFLEDGVPTRATGFFNHNALYEVNIPQSAGVEVLKGPGTALYGSDAIGGVVNVLTRPAPLEPTVEGNVEGGAYGYRRGLVSGGFTSGRNGIRADVNVTHSDNWKQAAPFNRQSGTVRWDLVGGRGWTAKTVLTGSNIDQQDVPAIDSAKFYANSAERKLNLAPIAFRKVQALRVSSAIEHDGGASLWSMTPYARYNVLELLPSWQLTYDPQVWDTRNTSLGVLTRYRRDFVPLRTRVILGADVELSPGSFKADQAVVTRTGTNRVWSSYTLGTRQYDYDVTYRALSPYIHTEFSPTSKLRFDLGLRADVSGYSYDNRLTPLDTGAHRRPASQDVSYTHLSPKVGMTYELMPAANFFASYRHGFRAPSQGQLFQQNSALNTVGLSPVKVDSYEMGIRGTLGSRALYQLSAYDMTIRDDIITYITSSGTREATNAGRTRHRGIEVSSGVALLPTVKLDASYSISTQRYVEWAPTASVSYSGQTIEQAPADLASAFLAWSPKALRGGRVAMEWSHTGSYYMDPANAQQYGGYDLFHLHASAQMNSRTEIFGRVTNLANVNFAELVAFDPSLPAAVRKQYTPGGPRMVYLGARLATR
jgi:iron complex outermembrane recepter protein